MEYETVQDYKRQQCNANMGTQYRWTTELHHSSAGATLPPAIITFQYEPLETLKPREDNSEYRYKAEHFK